LRTFGFLSFSPHYLAKEPFCQRVYLIPSKKEKKGAGELKEIKENKEKGLGETEQTSQEKGTIFDKIKRFTSKIPEPKTVEKWIKYAALFAAGAILFLFIATAFKVVFFK